MAKKKGKGKKGKKGKGGEAKPAVITTPQMQTERNRIAAEGEPLGHRFAVTMRGSALRQEVAGARLRKAIEAQQASLDLRGLALDAVPGALAVEVTLDEWDVPLPPANNAVEKHDLLWKALRAVDLSFNGLYKTADTFVALGCLGGRLQELSLKANALAGAVPAAAGKLTGLRKLNLDSNSFTSLSEEAAAGWAAVADFSAARNAFVVLPDSTQAWGKLERLDLHANKLAVLDPDFTFGSWPLLSVANLTQNQLSKLPPTVGACPALRALYVTNNKVGGLACHHN